MKTRCNTKKIMGKENMETNVIEKILTPLKRLYIFNLYA